MKKRIISAITVLMLMPCEVLSASAETLFYPNDEASIAYTIEDGEITIEGYAPYTPISEQELVIPQKIEGLPVTKIGDYAFNYDEFERVVLPDTIEYIGERAFSYCEVMTEINLPKSLKTIGELAFWNCCELDGITLPEGLETIGENAFNACSSLSSVTIPSSVTNLSQFAFSQCTGLKSVTLRNEPETLNTCVFQACESLTSFTIPKSVKSIGGNAFHRCCSLNQVIIPANVESIGKRGFCSNTSLKKFIISDATTTLGNYVVGFDMFVNSETIEYEKIDGLKIYTTTGSAAYDYATDMSVDMILLDDLGDYNLDGSVNSLDASEVLQLYASSATGSVINPTNDQMLNGDVNFDNTINAIDASEILGYYAYMSTGGNGNFLRYVLS